MSEFDLVVRGGTVVDGTGAPAREADVAVTNGRVCEVGRVSGRGTQEVEAAGAIVSPGFVDLHTHYDGQVSWDHRLQPSSWHGVTTVVTGNCGVGFAPAAAENRVKLIELMEGVEDIPGTALHEGLTWDWVTFPEYLDAIAAHEFDLDVAVQVPHAPLRVHVMGDRAVAREQATAEEISQMSEMVREAVDAGAFGFTTSRSLHHKSITGDVTPSYDAGADELFAISEAMGETGRGVLQMITDFDDPEVDFRLIRGMAKAANRPLSFSLVQHHGAPERYKEILRRLHEANEAGLDIKAQVPARSIGMVMSLQTTLHPFVSNPEWQRLAGLPTVEMARRMSEPEARELILASQTDEPSKLVGGNLIYCYEQMYELTDDPNYEPASSDSIEGIAQRSGNSPAEVAYDVLTSNEGSGMLLLTITNYAYGDLDVTRELLTDEYTVPGLSDGGAHVGMICDGSFPTTLLQHWVRDRDDGLDIEFVVKRQARDTARALGITDRGELTPGSKADINVIDLDGLRLRRPMMSYDLPGGAGRLLQRADGYKHTFVGGVETYRDGEPTGELPGRLLRSGG